MVGVGGVLTKIFDGSLIPITIGITVSDRKTSAGCGGEDVPLCVLRLLALPPS